MASPRQIWRRSAPYAVPALVFLAFLLAIFWRLWTPIEGGRRSFGWDAQWQYWGNLQFEVDALKDGELPLWNPHDRGGFPAHADPQPALLYPPTWPLLATAAALGSTPWWLVAVQIVFHFWLAGLGLYALLRARGNPLPACYAGGFIFILSYPFLHNVFSALNWNIAWAPWAMLALERWAARPSRARGAVVGVVLALMALAGGPASFWYGLLVVTAYGGWAIAHHARAATWRVWLRAAAPSAGVAAAIALAMVAAQFASTAELVRHSVRDTRDLEFITTSTFGLDDVAGLLIPRFTEGNPYLGFATVLWAGISLAAFPTARSLVLAGTAVLGIMCALGAHGDFLALSASALPPFGLFRRAHRYLYVAQLPIAILGAEGLAAIYRLEQAELRRVLRRAVLIVGAIGLTIFGVGFTVKAMPGQGTQSLRDAFGLGCLAVVVTTWVSYLMLARDGGWRSAFAAIAVVALATDLWFCRRSDIEERMWAVPTTRRDGELRGLAGVPLEARIYNRKYIPYRPGTRLHVRDFGGYEDDPLALARYAVMLRHMLKQPGHLGHANVRWLLLTPDKMLPMQAGDPALRKRKSGVFELAQVAPVVYWVDRAVVVDGGPAEALAALVATPPGTAAVLEAGSLDAGEAERAAAGDPAAPPVAGRIVDLHRNRLALEVDAPADGVVVVAESYYPHWSATVDGEPARILPANVQYRGLLVGPGRHRIEMVYRPPAWRLLALCDPLALCAAALLVGLERRRAGARREA